MEINVIADLITFDVSKLQEVESLFSQHLAHMRNGRQSWPVLIRYSATGLIQCNIGHSFNGTENHVATLWHSLGPLLNGPAHMTITDEDDESTDYFTGPDVESVDALKARTFANRCMGEISEASITTPALAAQFEALRGLLKEMINPPAKPEALANGVKTYSVFILAENANGQPEMLVTDVVATDEEYANGDHRELAESRAYLHGYHPSASFDADDPAARAVLRANCYTLPGEESPADSAVADAPAT